MIIQEDRSKQAEFERRRGSEPLDNLQRAEIFLPGVGSYEVEVELVGVGVGQEVSPAGKVFDVEKLVFFKAVYGFHIALVGVRGGRDAHVLAVAEHFGKVAFELPALVNLPDQIAQRDAVAIQMLLNA